MELTLNDNLLIIDNNVLDNINGGSNGWNAVKATAGCIMLAHAPLAIVLSGGIATPVFIIAGGAGLLLDACGK